MSGGEGGGGVTPHLPGGQFYPCSTEAGASFLNHRWQTMRLPKLSVGISGLGPILNCGVFQTSRS